VAPVRDAVLYSVLVLLSLCECLSSCAAEVAGSNISHINNGRKPDAGCSIFPIVPIVPVIYVLVASGLNHLLAYLGYGIVGTYGFLSTAVNIWRFRKVNAKLRTLIAQERRAT
jgi:hypothetical protein